MSHGNNKLMSNLKNDLQFAAGYYGFQPLVHFRNYTLETLFPSESECVCEKRQAGRLSGLPSLPNWWKHKFPCPVQSESDTDKRSIHSGDKSGFVQHNILCSAIPLWRWQISTFMIYSNWEMMQMSTDVRS